jgi:general secretion pathway protein H
LTFQYFAFSEREEHFLKRGSHGFTLIELLIVLIIVSVMAAMVSPAISRTLSSLKLQTATRKVAAALRYARTQAVSKAVPYQAVFNFDQRQVSISPAESGNEVEGEEETGEVKEEKPNPQEKEKPMVYNLPEEVKFLEIAAGEEEVSSGEATITFHANGGSEGGEIILSDTEEKRQYRITVHFLTGAVVLKEQG